MPALQVAAYPGGGWGGDLRQNQNLQGGEEELHNSAYVAPGGGVRNGGMDFVVSAPQGLASSQ